MSDNTGDKPSANPINTQSEDPSADIIPAKDAGPVNQKQETENMEVHYHPTTHGKKNWKTYLWEFLMVFLAVFCGFLAENQREHMVEHKRARVFARLLIDDLSADTAELNKASRVLNNIIIAGDSLGRLLNSKDIRTIPGGKLYYYEYWSGWRWNVISRDATLQQLKNSGSLRYLGDTSIIRKILIYEESIRVIYMLQNKYEPEKIQNWNLAQRVFDHGYFNALDTIAPRDSTTKNFELDNQKLADFLDSRISLYSYDKNVLQELRNWAYSSSENYSVIIHDIHSAKQRAHAVIEALKKEYQLK